MFHLMMRLLASSLLCIWKSILLCCAGLFVLLFIVCSAALCRLRVCMRMVYVAILHLRVKVTVRCYRLPS